MDRSVWGKRFALFVPAFALAFAGCGAVPVRSTVDAYGEPAPDESGPLCFVRDAIPLRDRPASDACREAARSRGLPVGERESNCTFVVASTDVAAGSTEVTQNPSFSTSFGYGRGWGYRGLGFGSGSTEVVEQAARTLRLEFYADRELKRPRRSIIVRSSGRESSALAVAAEMCEAAFEDYPANLSGKVYEIKPR
jgi:hypothetical protein